MNLFSSIRQWNRQNRSVRALSQLSDRELADIGVARGEIKSRVRGIR